MRKKSDKGKVKSNNTKHFTFSEIVKFIESKTSCCDVDDGVLVCVIMLGKENTSYNLSISTSEKLFHLHFFRISNSQDFEQLGKDVTLFFKNYLTLKKQILKKDSYIVVDVPADKIKQVITELDFFYPDLDETKIIDGEFEIIFNEEDFDLNSVDDDDDEVPYNF